MPVRILREGILTSERVDKLSPHAEVFYRRLMSVVDDFGRFSANPKLLRAACYPLRLDTVSDTDVMQWLQACVDVALVMSYEVNDKQYLEFINFQQRTRAKSGKCPPPPTSDSRCRTYERQMQDECATHDSHRSDTCQADVGHMPVNCQTHDSQTRTNARLDGDGDGDEINTLSGKPDDARNDETEIEKSEIEELEAESHSREGKKTAAEQGLAHDVIRYLNEKSGRSYRTVSANVRLVKARLREGATAEQIKAVIDAKVRQWGRDPTMAEYLRPETLFGATKFEQYLGQVTAHGATTHGLLRDARFVN